MIYGLRNVLPISLVALLGLSTSFLSLFVGYRLVLLFISLAFLLFVVAKISTHRVLFVTTSLMPIVYMPLEFTNGQYYSFTYVLLILSFVLAYKYRTYVAKSDAFEKVAIAISIYIFIRILIIGVFIEGNSFASSFSLLSSDLAKIISGVIFYRLSKSDQLKPDIIRGLFTAFLVLIGFQVYQTYVGVYRLIDIGYIAPQFNYNTALGDMRAFSTFLTPVAFGTYLAMIISFLMWSYAEKPMIRFFKWIFIGIGIIALIFTETRGAWIAFFLSTLIILMISRVISWTRLMIFSILFIPIITISVMLFPEVFVRYADRLSTITDLTYSSNSIRLQLWTGAMEAISRNWLIGYGQSDFALAVSSYIPQNLSTFTHPHETYLEFLFKYGIVGFLLYISLFIITVYKLLKTIRELPIDKRKLSIVASALGASLIFIFSSFTESFWGSYNLYITLFLIIGFGTQQNKKEGNCMPHMDKEYNVPLVRCTEDADQSVKVRWAD